MWIQLQYFAQTWQRSPLQHQREGVYIFSTREGVCIYFARTRLPPAWQRYLVRAASRHPHDLGEGELPLLGRHATTLLIGHQLLGPAVERPLRPEQGMDTLLCTLSACFWVISTVHIQFALQMNQSVQTQWHFGHHGQILDAWFLGQVFGTVVCLKAGLLCLWSRTKPKMKFEIVLEGAAGGVDVSINWRHFKLAIACWNSRFDFWAEGCKISAWVRLGTAQYPHTQFGHGTVPSHSALARHSTLTLSFGTAQDPHTQVGYRTVPSHSGLARHSTLTLSFGTAQYSHTQVGHGTVPSHSGLARCSTLTLNLGTAQYPHTQVGHGTVPSHSGWVRHSTLTLTWTGSFRSCTSGRRSHAPQPLGRTPSAERSPCWGSLRLQSWSKQTRTFDSADTRWIAWI